MSYEDIEHILETYSLDDILEFNELSEVDVLFFLIQQRFLELPNPKPVDYNG